jgi:hypothetical protein
MGVIILEVVFVMIIGGILGASIRVGEGGGSALTEIEGVRTSRPEGSPAPWG